MPTLQNALLPPIDFRASFPLLRSLLLPATGPGAAADKPGAPEFELVEHVGADRASVEAFISQRFAESFGSRIEAFMPRLFSVRSRDGEIRGAFGLRSAHCKLFLEQYLDTPIEATIAARTGTPVGRRGIIEVGHFSGAFPGAVRAMIALLTERLHRDGYEWVVFTGTAGLRNAFCRMGLPLIDIQAATLDRLPADARAAWGSYYDHAPRVLVGNIAEGYRAMRAPHGPGEAA